MNTGSFPLLALLRPKHWAKNILIFLPVILAGKFRETPLIIDAMLGFVSFSLMASSGYILNDIRDIDRDRAHPRKSRRPLAAAQISVVQALAVAIILLGISVAMSAYLGKIPLLYLLVYFVLNYLYSTFLKAVRFFDIIILSSFYLIRLFYGSAVTDAELTGWFLATTTLSFLTLSTNKRFMECLLSKHDKIPGRGYTKEDATFLQIFSVTFAVGTLVLLNMHAFFVLHIQAPLAIGLINLFAAGIMFAYFDNKNNMSDDPVDRVLKNPLLLVMTVLFIAVYAWEVISRT